MSSSIIRRSPLLAVFASLALGASACSGCDKGTPGPEATAGSAAVTVDAAPAAPASAARRMPPRGGGPLSIFVVTARSLVLSDAQTARIDKAVDSLRGDEASAHDEMKALHADLVSGVKAGKLEQAKIDADLAAIEKAETDRHDKEAAALNEVHAALEPAQRAAVVAKIREHREASEKRMAARSDGGARDGGKHGRRGPRRGDHLTRLTKDLGLDAEQEKKVEALGSKDEAKASAEVKDARSEAKKRAEALLSAFEKDDFDAKKLDAPDPKRARVAAEEEVKLLGGLLPILKPEQREKLAESLEKRTTGGPGGPGHARGPRGRRGFPFKVGASGLSDYDFIDEDDDEDLPQPGPPAVP